MPDCSRVENYAVDISAKIRKKPCVETRTRARIHECPVNTVLGIEPCVYLGMCGKEADVGHCVHFTLRAGTICGKLQRNLCAGILWQTNLHIAKLFSKVWLLESRTQAQSSGRFLKWGTYCRLLIKCNKKNNFKQQIFASYSLSDLHPPLHKPFDRPKRRLIGHFCTLFDPVAQIKVVQSQLAAALDLPKDAVGAVAGARLVRVVERVDRRKSIFEPVNQADHLKFSAPPELEKIGAYVAMQQEMLVP